MIEKAINRILEFRDVHHLEINGRNYTDKHIEPVYDPQPPILAVSTLTGIVDYLEANVDELCRDNFMLHVQSHYQVNLIPKITGPFMQRPCYVRATYDRPSFQFGNFMDVETFIIAMQSQFVQAGSTASLLKIVGNLKHEEGIQQKDDGVTQEVTTKTGITKVEPVEVPNPVILQPYRTFLEINQPESKFVFRMRSSGSGISCALFEADGGGWKLESICRIRNWLKEELPEMAIVA